MVYVIYVPPSREAALNVRRRLLSQCPRLIEELAEVTTNLERQTQRLLPGGTVALAASEFQRILKGGRRERGREERARAAPIKLTVVGRIRDTVELLSKIEQTSRLLTVKDIKVRVVAVGQPCELMTTLVVAGYLLPTAGSN